MAKQPDEEYRYILCSNGSIYDLLDPRLFDTDINTTIEKIKQKEVTIVKWEKTPTKLFSLIVGKKVDSCFLPFPGGSNWSKLFTVRDQFDYFLGYTTIDNQKYLSAKSLDGYYWSFDIIDT